MILKKLNKKEKSPIFIGLFSFCYGLASAIVVTTTATAVVATVVVGTVVTAAAEEDDDEDYNPRTVITTKVTHLRKPPFLFSSHTMQKSIRLLQILKFKFLNKKLQLKIILDFS